MVRVVLVILLLVIIPVNQGGGSSVVMIVVFIPRKLPKGSTVRHRKVEKAFFKANRVAILHSAFDIFFDFFFFVFFV